MTENANQQSFKLTQIGVVKSPYNEQSGTPIQPDWGEKIEAEIHVFPGFREALSDLDGFDRIWVISYLDRGKPYKLKVIPYRDTVERGLFATRAPNRPSPIGISPVQLLSVDTRSGILRVKGIDLLDGTPVLDIKPYSTRFDSHTGIKSGWLDDSKNVHTADDRFEMN